MPNQWMLGLQKVSFINRTSSWPKYLQNTVIKPLKHRHVYAFALIGSIVGLTSTALIMTYVYPFNAIIPLSRQRAMLKQSQLKSNPQLILANPRGLITLITLPTSQRIGVDPDGIVYQESAGDVTRSTNYFAGINNPLNYLFNKPWTVTIDNPPPGRYSLIFYATRGGSFPISINHNASHNRSSHSYSYQIHIKPNYGTKYTFNLDPNNLYSNKLQFESFIPL